MGIPRDIKGSYMFQETSKRAATSQVGGPDRDPKRLRLSADLWLEGEHLTRL